MRKPNAPFQLLAAALLAATACTDPTAHPATPDRSALVESVGATANIVACPPTIPPGYTLVYCFDFDFIPGVWHGFLLQQSTTPAQLSHHYLLLAPTWFNYVVPGTVLDLTANSYTFQPEYNGVVWNDVVRFMLSNQAAPQRITIAVARRANSGPPVASAGGPYTGNEGAPISFSAAASTDPDNDALTYDWDFGDGATGTGVSPSHAYADNGSYTATVTVRDGLLSSTANAAVTIANVAPTGSLQAPGSVPQGSNFTVSVQNASDPSPVDQASLAFRFDCGAGWAPLGPASSRSCTAPVSVGSITLKGRVLDKDLGMFSKTRVVLVTNVKPAVSLNVPPVVTVTLGTPVTIGGTFSDPGSSDNPWTGRVVWGQGVVPLGAVTPGQSMATTLNYASRGTFEARLEVTDKHGATGRAVLTVVVQ